VAAVVGIALVLVLVQMILIGQLIPPLTIFALLSLVVAAVVATGWRWAPLLGAIWSSLVIGANLENVVHDLTHPEAFRSFALVLIALAVAIVGIGAGVGASIQNYRAGERRAPRWLTPALMTLVGLCVGALLIAAIPRSSTATGVSAEVMATLPIVSTTNHQFDQREIRARVGETIALRLENNDTGMHSFDIDALNVHVPMLPGKSGLALFKVTEPGTYRFYCAVPGHQMMQGTLIVQP
jgi:heme/copper-type cytochrome/quinol oxidase subunit 2